MATAVEPFSEGEWTFSRTAPFKLEAGGSLKPVTLRYAVYGELNPARDNAILVCHALSGSARVADWWPAMVGPGRFFDTSRYCILGINALGSCYGSTGPTSSDPKSHKPYGGSFPLVSVPDIVRAQAELLDHLEIKKLRAVVGGSIGGMQALQWTVDFPDRVVESIAIGASPLGAMGLALNHLQRQAIRNDIAWNGGEYDVNTQPARGIALARAIAMCSYKSAQLFDERYGRRPNRSGEDPYTEIDSRFDVAGYLDYQGESFGGRFDANSYIILTKAMDMFHLGRDAKSEEDVLGRIRARVLLVGITSDWLFPAADIRRLAKRMDELGVKAKYAELESSHGHDAFLADCEGLAGLLRKNVASLHSV